jgi:phage gpG-like protein
VQVFVGTNVEYARQREYGGVIEARNAPWLVWQDYEGNWHRARRVEQAATPFLRPALDENRDAVRREVAAALRQLIGLG